MHIEEKAELGRAIMAAPRLGRADRARQGPNDEKFALGDLIADVPDEQLDALATAIGHNLSAGLLKTYRTVSAAWPPERRVAASWTTHRTLKDTPDRFDRIGPGMTLRAAQAAIGKNPADTEHPSRWELDRKVPFIIDELLNSQTVQQVRQELDQRKKARAAKAVVKMVEEDQSAEYRLALRQLREARDAKHPERAAYDALFKVREAREYVRAVGKAGSEDHSFLPEHMRPNLIAAVRDLAQASAEAVAAFAQDQDSSITTSALEHLQTTITKLQRRPLTTSFAGTVIVQEVENSA